MKLVGIVEILGSYLQTTRKNHTGLSSKVVPRIAFTPMLTRLPKAILEKIQSAIADTIWKEDRFGDPGASFLQC